jgi:protein-tyrosine phosphatase
MNKKDFITHAEEGVRIMDQALAKGGKIYVHCTAGIYRSPQMIALYLVAIKKYNI